MDQWQQHVSLEISEAVGYDQRLLEIAEALMQMDTASLIPEAVSDQLFNQISIANSGGQ